MKTINIFNIDIPEEYDPMNQDIKILIKYEKEDENESKNEKSVEEE